MPKHLSPVKLAARLLGGVRGVAAITGVTPGTISRWDRNERMTLRAQRLILEVAKAREIDLKPDELVLGRDVAR